jgi:hypothetical protein
MSLKGSIPVSELEQLAVAAKTNGVEAVEVAVFQPESPEGPWLSLAVSDGENHYGGTVIVELAEKTT